MKLSTCLLIVAIAVLPTMTEAAVTVDAAAEKQPFLGLGAQVRLGEEALEPSFAQLGLRWARLDLPAMQECPLADGSLPDFYRYFKRAVPAEQLAALGAMLNRHQTAVILSSSGMPTSWLDASQQLPTERLEMAAQMWAGAVQYLTQSGLRPRYLEPVNCTGECQPADYNRLVQYIRRELDELGYSEIALCGPGLNQAPEQWIAALDTPGLAAVEAWSLAGSEPESATASGKAWPADLLTAIAQYHRADPKPIFITHYGGCRHALAGHISPAEAYLTKTAAQTPAWCVHVLEEGVHSLNAGASALVYTELADPPTAATNFGAHTRLEDGAHPQMIHQALASFFPQVADGFHVLNTTATAEPGLSVAALKKGQRVVCCLVNATQKSQTTAVQLNNYEAAKLTRKNVFAEGQLTVLEPGTVVDTTTTVTVPAGGAVTLVFDPAAPQATGESIIHVDQPQHRVEGFGANAWIGDPGALAVLKELGMKWVRLNMEGIRTFDQADAADYVAYFDRITEWDRLKYLWAIKKAQRLRFMLVSYGAPQIWCEPEGKKLKAEHADDFARLWAAGMKAYADKGLAPDYIELFNEPDGDWDTYCSPEIYNQVVSAVRRELDRYGLEKIKIVGPGRAHIDVGDTDTWVAALDAQGDQALAAFSIHSWTWHGPKSHSPQYVRDSSRGFLQSVAQLDPEHKRLRMLTEFLAKDFVIDDVKYGDHAKNFKDTAVDTVPYAVHVTEDLLSHLSAGFNTIIVWQMADQWWEQAGWGLLGKMGDGYPRKPIFHALKMLLPEITPGFRALHTEQEGDVFAAAFVRRNRVIVALANSTCHPQVQRIRLPGVEQAVLFKLKCYTASGTSQQLPRETIQGEWLAELPASSITVAIFKLPKTRTQGNER